jgi:hypothetical protein
MTAVRKIRFEEPVLATNAAPARTAKLYVVTSNAPAEAPEATGSALKNVALFFAAPFIGLAYIVALPVVGLGFMAMLAWRAAAKYDAVRMAARVVKNIGMVVAAPAIGLAFIALFPFIGLASLLWMAGKGVAGVRA